VHPYFQTAIREISTGKIVRLSRPIPLSQYPFHVSERDGQLWRYGDYWKLRGLLVAGEMYFRRADRLPDVKEGRFTTANLAGVSLVAESLGLPGGNKSIIEIQESHRCRTFLGCWHKNQAENPVMWSSYTTCSESIVIVCKTSNLLRAIEGRCQAFDIRYISDNEPIPDFHSLSVFAHKRKDPFEFEHELRLAYMLSREESVWLDKEEDFGRTLKVNPSDFIEEVRFHPRATDSFKAQVQADIAASGLRIVIRNSESIPSQ
jgi:hypothetical protein